MKAFEKIEKLYEQLGNDDPYWAVLSYEQYKAKRNPDLKEFYQTGVVEIAKVLEKAEGFGYELAFSKALDFGCGVGRLTNALAERFEEAIGVDISNSMVETARQNQKHPNCEFIANKRGDLSLFETDTFDFVYSNITLQHIPYPQSENYIKEFIRVAKPNGIIAFIVPTGSQDNRGSILSRIKQWRRETLRPWFKKIRGKPAVQIHPIAKDKVEDIIREAGGDLLRSDVDSKYGKGTRKEKPVFYWIRKSAT